MGEALANTTEINIIAVLVADLMAVTMLFIVLLSSHWIFERRTKARTALIALIVFSLISCVIDFIAQLVVGNSDPACIALGYVTNTWLYDMAVIVGPLWVFFLAHYLGVKLPSWSAWACLFVVVVSILFSVVNLFQPLVFSFDAYGIYKRESFYWYYFVVEAAFFLLSVAIYIYARRTGGALKFFPLWVFAVPVVIGIVLQTALYGISTIWPFLAIALCGVVTCLQGELIFRDALTGLYNRFYLESVVDKAVRKNETKNRADHLTILWMDVNNFKSINDTYGHAVGDKALVAVGSALNNSVGVLGTAIRYSGDEFVALLNTQVTDQVNACMSTISATLSGVTFANTNMKGISVAIGCISFDPASQPLEEALNCADALMYESKRAFHEAGGAYDRRGHRTAEGQE